MTFQLGKYTVRIGLRLDNPAFPVYLIYLAGKLIGKSFSMPDEGCCRWLERQELDRLIYAKREETAKLKQHTLRGRVAERHRAKRNALELEET